MGLSRRSHCRGFMDSETADKERHLVLLNPSLILSNGQDPEGSVLGLGCSARKAKRIPPKSSGASSLLTVHSIALMLPLAPRGSRQWTEEIGRS